METNESIVIASQVVSENGQLALGDIPLDLGLAQLLNSAEDQVVLSDGKVVKLTGTDDDILAVAMDYNLRSRHAVINAYMGGVNLARLRNNLVDTCGYSVKQFYEKVTALTGYSRGPLEKRIKMAEAYSKEQMQLLAEAGATQATALLLLKASPEKREEVLDEAREGLQLNNQVVSEILGVDDEDEDDNDDESSPSGDNKSSSGGGGGGNGGGGGGGSTSTKTAKSVKPKPATEAASDAVIDVEGSFTNYTDVVQDVKDYSPQNISIEQRFRNVIAAVEDSRTKHELSTVRGEAVRCAMANVLAGVYGIQIPTEVETKNEPEWFKALREKLPINKKTGGFKSLYVMAFIDGHLAVVNKEEAAPIAYEGLLKTMKKEEVDALYDLWSEGFAQGKERLAQQGQALDF